MGKTTIAAVAGAFAGDLDANFAQIERTLGKARAGGAALVAFPEWSLGGYLDPDTPAPLDPDGPEIARLIELAGDTVVCAGYVEPGPDGPYSSAICVSGDGVLGRHRKVHVPPGEAGRFAAGEGFAAFETPVGRLGMLLCYDKVFPEAARELALDGAEVIASLAAWPICRVRPARRIVGDHQTRQFNLLDEARALENQVVWVSANQAGSFGGLRFLGHAKVVDPRGVVLDSTSARAGIAVADVDVPGALGGARAIYSHLGARRPTAYGQRRRAARSSTRRELGSLTLA
jgi:predicted amidohydrolase